MNPALVKALVEQACWRHIGVWGTEQHRCEKLESIRHCRNCDVFSEAAKTVFRRESTEVELFERSLDLYHCTEFERKLGDISVLPFRIGCNWFCVYPKEVVSISQSTVVHSIPNRKSNFVRGLVAVDGAIYTSIALDSLLKENCDSGTPEVREKRPGVFARTVILQTGRKRLAVNVDEVRNVYQYDSNEIKPPSDKVPKELSSFIEKEYVFDSYLNEPMYQLNLEPVEQEYYKALV